MIFNERLKLLRKEKGLTQMQAAEALGINYRHYQRLESDGTAPNYANLVQISDFFGVSLDYLAGRAERAGGYSAKSSRARQSARQLYRADNRVSRGVSMFSQRIRLLRNERHLTQVDAARAVGLSARGYQDLELGVTPRGDTLLAIAEFYHVSMDWLMGRTDVREVNR